MIYDRKIKYFDYMENGQRLRNAGFVKLEVRDDICNFLIQISGLHALDNNTRKLYLTSGDKKEELCDVFLKQGKGNVQLQLQRSNLCGGIPYDQLEDIYVLISPGRELFCKITEKEKEKESVLPSEEQSLQEEKVLPKSSEMKELSVIQAEDFFQEQEQSQEKEQNLVIDKIQSQEEEPDWITDKDQLQVKEQDLVMNEEIPLAKEKENSAPLLDDKWKQLSAIYPHLAPFEDERDYLSVGPSDFVILTQRYYRLINNSFLLHGFYNYKHLILTRMENRGEVRFYIGVPGNFYDREKQVALMFGFESFECREEPAGYGDFGYYMIRVEI